MNVFNKIYYYIVKNLSLLAIGLVFVFMVGKTYKSEYWLSPDKILIWDVKSYYGYLPAAIIYKDLKFKFLEENPELKKDIWVLTLDNGNKLIITSMGMSYLYLPGFLVADLLAEPLGFERTGYSPPYRLSVIVSAIVFLMLGLFVVRKILLKYTNEFFTAFSIIVVALGTNLISYVLESGGMSHTYNFALITFFIYLVSKYYSSYQNKVLFFIGFLAGLITLIRPTNIIVLLIFFFYDIFSLQDLKDRILFFIHRIPKILVMILMFLIPWMPQFALWKIQTGQFLFFSYGEAGASFFFGNPQILNFLFSYWKGWLIYTPIMIFAIVGIVWLFKTRNRYALSITVLLISSIYILSSWWSWWFGGSFGQRSMIDFYGLLMIPFAVFLFSLRKRLFLIIPLTIVVLVLVWYNLFQFRQYKTGALHYLNMTKEMYWESFLKEYPTKKFKEITRLVDYDKARQGIYVLRPPEENKKPEPVNQKLLQELKERLLNNPKVLQGILKKHQSNDTAKLIENDALWLIKYKDTYVEKNAVYNQIEKLRNNPLQMKKMEEKAKKNGISIEEQLEKDAIWIVKRR